jgi:hypothetical protein
MQAARVLGGTDRLATDLDVLSSSGGRAIEDKSAATKPRAHGGLERNESNGGALRMLRGIDATQVLDQQSHHHGGPRDGLECFLALGAEPLALQRLCGSVDR